MWVIFITGTVENFKDKLSKLYICGRHDLTLPVYKVQSPKSYSDQ